MLAKIPRKARISGASGLGLALAGWALDVILENPPAWLVIGALGFGVCLIAYALLTYFFDHGDVQDKIEAQSKPKPMLTAEEAIKDALAHERQTRPPFTNMPDAERALRIAARAIALDNLRGRLIYADRVERSGDRTELIKWRAKAATQQVLGKSRLLAIDPDAIGEDQAERLETAILLLEEVNQTVDSIAEGVGYQRIQQAAGMYRARGEKLYAILAELGGLEHDWRPTDDKTD